MTNLAQRIHKSAADSYEQKDIKNFKTHIQYFLDLLLDLDCLLASRTEYNFDQWISDARRWGKKAMRKIY